MLKGIESLMVCFGESSVVLYMGCAGEGRFFSMHVFEKSFDFPIRCDVSKSHPYFFLQLPCGCFQKWWYPKMDGL